jgi:hypothetical protein
VVNVMRGKKLRGNGLWESSRIILPEFREAITNQRLSLNGRQKPEYDEQRVEELSAAIAEAIMSGAATAVTTFGDYGDKTMVGVVMKIDPIERVIRLRMRADTVQISLEEIINISRV